MIKVKDTLAHPLGIAKVIKGDIRERVDMTTGASLGKGNGHVLYEVSEDQGRPWFLIDFESGGRIVYRKNN